MLGKTACYLIVYLTLLLMLSGLKSFPYLFINVLYAKDKVIVIFA